MKALVTGGSGFIGSHVVDKLMDKGVNVRIYDMVYPDFRNDVEFYKGSLLDFDSLLMSMNGVDAVFHLAAVADVKDVFEEPHYSEAINVRGTMNVLEAMRRTGRLKRIIYGSTTWVYSEAEAQEVDEGTPLHAPSHLYTATKMTGEYYCKSYASLYDLEPTILRYGIPYGPRARDGAVIPIFTRKAINGDPLTVAGDGSQFRKFVYVEDLAEGNVLALKSIAKGKIYNLDGNEKITIKQIAETVQKIVGDVEIKSIPGRPGDFSGKEVSSLRAQNELGWVPKVSFEEGVRKYIDWYRARADKNTTEWAAIDDSLREHL